MVYVSSDWHGWPLEKIRKLLQQAGFGEEDELYILGDVIDRGKEGAALLQWLVRQSNVTFVLGNHEQMLLSCEDFIREPTTDSLSTIDYRGLQIYQNWKRNGGIPTIDALRELAQKNPEELELILEYLHQAPMAVVTEVGEKEYILVHGGLGDFYPEKQLEDYEPNDLLWARPAMDTRYYEDATVIFGHTPTAYYGREYIGKPIFTDTWINIDVGAAGGMPPLLLRLDDMKQFY